MYLHIKEKVYSIKDLRKTLSTIASRTGFSKFESFDTDTIIPNNRKVIFLMNRITISDDRELGVAMYTHFEMNKLAAQYVDSAEQAIVFYDRLLDFLTEIKVEFQVDQAEGILRDIEDQRFKAELYLKIRQSHAAVFNLSFSTLHLPDFGNVELVIGEEPFEEDNSIRFYYKQYNSILSIVGAIDVLRVALENGELLIKIQTEALQVLFKEQDFNPIFQTFANELRIAYVHKGGRITELLPDQFKKFFGVIIEDAYPDIKQVYIPLEQYPVYKYQDKYFYYIADKDKFLLSSNKEELLKEVKSYYD